MGTKLRVITNSEMSCFRRCQREHFFAYIQGYRAIEDAESLRFGTMIHVGLERMWLGDDLDAACDAAAVGAVDEFEAARVRVLLRGYEARWGREYADEVVGVEREFRAPLINPDTGAASRTYVLGGKMDVLLRTRFVEHKTTSDDIGTGSVYWQTLSMNSQVSTYYAGARSLGHAVESCIYDVIRKPAIRPSQVPVLDDAGFKIVLDQAGERVYCKAEKKGVGQKPRETADKEKGYVLQTRPETVEEYEARLVEEVASNPDKYFQRGEVVRLETEEREHAFDTWQIAQSMREAERLDRHPRNADACRRYGRLCSFFPVCTGTASLDDASRYQKLDNVHKELTADLDAAE